MHPAEELSMIGFVRGSTTGLMVKKPNADAASAPRPKVRIVGRSPVMREALDLAERYASSTAPTLLRGETGTGKELFALRIHECRGDAGKPVIVDLGSIAPSVQEAELFGHVRGAFTGAVSEKRGLLESAAGGMVFLDEIGDASPEVQLRLLRFLQEGAVRRVGATSYKKIEVKVVAATCQNLEKMVDEGRFRRDLYHRLAWGVVHIPPLRERGYDIIRLSVDFLKTSPHLQRRRRGLSRDARRLLLRLPWPGNVRDLHRALYQSAFRRKRGPITALDIEEALKREVQVNLADTRPLTPAREIIGHLERYELACAAEFEDVLGLSRSGVQRELEPLVASGRVVRVGSGSACRYRLPGDDDADRLGGRSSRWQRAREVVERMGEASRSDVARVLGFSNRTATRILTDMEKAGVLRAKGAGNRRVYVLAPDLRLVAGGEAALRTAAPARSDADTVPAYADGAQ